LVRDWRRRFFPASNEHFDAVVLDGCCQAEAVLEFEGRARKGLKDAGSFADCTDALEDRVEGLDGVLMII